MPALAAMGLTDPLAAGMVEHRETFDGVGEIGSWVLDLHAAWTAALARSRIVIERKGALRVYETTLDAPPAIVWEYVTSPALRPKWQYGVEAVQQESGPAGRRGIGTVNHCIHGKDAIIEEVLDWQPNDYVTYRSLLPAPGVPKLANTFAFEDLGDGRTRMTAVYRPAAIGEGQGDRRRPAASARRHDRARARIADHADCRQLRSAASADAPAEPELPSSRGRNVSEPAGG